MNIPNVVVAVICCQLTFSCLAQTNNNFTVTAYFYGGPEKFDSLAVDKLTHIIFSFCHLSGNKLTVDDEKDSQAIKKLVAAKQRNKSLKVLLSLGGWEAAKRALMYFHLQKEEKNSLSLCLRSAETMVLMELI